MALIGFILFWSGLFLWLAGNLMFLSVVFRHSVAWFFGCAFIPLADLVYFLFNVKQTWKPMALATAGCLIAVIGCCIDGFNLF